MIGQLVRLKGGRRTARVVKLEVPTNEKKSRAFAEKGAIATLNKRLCGYSRYTVDELELAHVPGL